MAMKKEIRKRKRLSSIGVKGSRRKAAEITERMETAIQESKEARHAYAMEMIAAINSNENKA